MNASLAAAPADTVTEALTALVNDPSDAVRVYVPGLSILQPAKGATPLTADFGFVVQDNDAPAGVVSASVTELASDVAVLPAASCTVTTGCVANVAPAAAAAEGWVVNASFAAAPADTVIDALTALVNEPSEAVSV